MRCRQELAFRERRLEKIREAMAALEAEAQAAAEQAEAEGGKHPGVPDDKAQRIFTDTESRMIPAPGGKDFLHPYNWAVVDSAHPGDRLDKVVMMEETIDNVGAVPREVTCWLLLRHLSSGRGPVRRAGVGPATAGLCHAATEVAYPALVCGPDATENRTDQAGSAASLRSAGIRQASSCCGDWRRSANGR